MKNAYAIGSKVYLRSPTLEDAEGSWHEWFSDHEVTRYLVDRYMPNSKEAQIEFFKSLHNSKDRVVFSICRIDNDEHIGVCGLSAINWFHGNADISYVLGKKESNGLPIIIDAVKLLIDASFNRMNLSNLRGTHAGKNKITPMLDKILGFQTIGKLEGYIICEGERDDLVISHLSKSSWLSKNKVIKE